MNVKIIPQRLHGTITPPPSKSQAHRAIIAASLAEGKSLVRNVSASQDITATLGCMTALGAKAVWRDDAIEIWGIGDRRQTDMPRFDCGESGSTLRFLIPIALAISEGGIFCGRGRLMRRPQDPYFSIFQEKGIAFSQGSDTLSIKGSLTPGEFRLPGNISSQFITGLLYALPLLHGDSEIVLTTELESSGYVDLTVDTLQQFGVFLERMKHGWYIPGNQKYQPQNVAVEADYSQAAFFYAAKGLGNDIRIEGMNSDSHQGDKRILNFEARLNEPGLVELDVRECPDLVPALAARAAFRPEQTTHIVNAGRLRLKESDRLAAITEVLHSLGAEIVEESEGLLICGKDSLFGGVTVDAWNDHRIAMMTAIAASRCKNTVTITGAECVRKSYPSFWKDYMALGGRLEMIE